MLTRADTAYTGMYGRVYTYHGTGGRHIYQGGGFPYIPRVVGLPIYPGW